MNQKHIKWVVIGMVIFASLIRISLFPWNFSPIIAMALFGGACIHDKRVGFMLPILAMFVSDVLFEVFNIAPGFWGWGQFVNYGALVLISFLGTRIRRVSTLPVVLGTVGASLLFFFLSNSAVWLFDTSYYAKDFSGLMDCLIMGLPFLKGGVIADLFYSAVFFGAYQFSVSRSEARVAS